ncbi:MAG: UxaA family hydrolase [Spirochaetales bacterium]|nr:UxaA family hydrolase [Spirochaetales bacterium]
MDRQERAVVLNDKDNVATALADLEAGSEVTVEAGGRTVTIKLTSRIPFGHKFSLARIERGAPVTKYGEAIGNASTAIDIGDYVHVHNVISTRGSTGREGADR